MYSPLFVTLMGIGTVFFGLVCIIVLTTIMGAVLKSNAKPAPAPAPATTANAGEEWICSSCGAKNSGRFCPNCGAGKPAVRSACDNCGWAPAAGQSMPKFCPECGRPLR